MSIARMLDATARFFHEAGIDTARLDAELIIARAIGSDRHRLQVESDRELTGAEIKKIEALSRRRIGREPIAYILGEKEFYSLDFIVNRSVLVPRPETELLVDLSVYYAPMDSRFLDLGTGSGAIAVSVKHNRPDCRVFASDISKEALAVARKNASRITGTSSVKFVLGDLFSPWDGVRFHVIASNPPYVAMGTLDSLPGELAWEPEHALFAGKNGRETIDRIVRGAGKHLFPGGVLLLEIGSDMKDHAHRVGGMAGFDVSVMQDYAGLPRVAVMKSRDRG